MPSSDPVPLEGFDSQRAQLTPVPLAGTVAMVRQDGTVAAFDLSGRERWVVAATQPAQAPSPSTDMIAAGPGRLLLDDNGWWSCLMGDDGTCRWAPVHFGSLPHSRRGTDDRYWAYIESADGIAVAALDVGSGAVTEVGRRDDYATVVAARADYVVAVENGDVVRLDITPGRGTGLSTSWRRSWRDVSAGTPRAALDVVGAVEIGDLVVLPFIGYGLAAVDHDGSTAWQFELGEFSAPSVAAHDGVLHVLDEQYLSLASTGDVLQAVDIRRSAGRRLGQVHSPRVHRERVFGVGSAGVLFCVNPAQDGITWSFSTREGTPRGCGLALAEGQLWTMDVSGSVYGFLLP